jgi:hypothetical protein
MQLYKLSKVSDQTPLYTPVDDLQAVLKCACKDKCPASCQCLCHTLSPAGPRRIYLARLKTHGSFFVIGAIWSALLLLSWISMGATVALFLAACLLLFFWIGDLLRFFDDKRPNWASRSARVKKV